MCGSTASSSCGSSVVIINRPSTPSGAFRPTNHRECVRLYTKSEFEELQDEFDDFVNQSLDNFPTEQAKSYYKYCSRDLNRALKKRSGQQGSFGFGFTEPPVGVISPDEAIKRWRNTQRPLSRENLRPANTEPSFKLSPSHSASASPRDNRSKRSAFVHAMNKLPEMDADSSDADVESSLTSISASTSKAIVPVVTSPSKKRKLNDGALAITPRSEVQPDPRLRELIEFHVRHLVEVAGKDPASRFRRAVHLLECSLQVLEKTAGADPARDLVQYHLGTVRKMAGTNNAQQDAVRMLDLCLGLQLAPS